MSIHIACDCGKEFAVAEKYAGRQGKCPGCGRILTVPSLAASRLDALVSTTGQQPVEAYGGTDRSSLRPPSPELRHVSNSRPGHLRTIAVALGIFGFVLAPFTLGITLLYVAASAYILRPRKAGLVSGWILVVWFALNAVGLPILAPHVPDPPGQDPATRHLGLLLAFLINAGFCLAMLTVVLSERARAYFRNDLRACPGCFGESLRMRLWPDVATCQSCGLSISLESRLR